MDREELKKLVEDVWGITQAIAEDIADGDDEVPDLEKLEAVLKDAAQRHNLDINFGDLFIY